ncbi:MAG: hypothetical protein WBF90_24475 [Rivularia sp. (in: cyanobacteria)]
MKPNSLALSLISGTVALLGLGLGTAKVNAQTFPFEATYKTESTFEPIQGQIFKSTVTGESTDAPYGLTNLIKSNYIQRNDDAGVQLIVTDAAEFGIEGLPILSETFFGSGDDKLFATTTGTVTQNFEEFTTSISGTTTIVGGEGNFAGATGILTFLENTIFDPNATTQPSTTGTAVLTGSFTVPQQVPEAGNTNTIFAIGIIGTGLLLHKRRYSIGK